MSSKRGKGRTKHTCKGEVNGIFHKKTYKFATDETYNKHLRVFHQVKN